ncbi:MAG: GPR endopeptidase [Clostridia bacterium]|nr:GPR endopeptidase [Clostridia bacterium]
MCEIWQSDLARECGCETESAGVRVSRAAAGEFEILRVRIGDDEAAARIGKPCGRYVTVAREGLFTDSIVFEEARRVLAVELREMAERMTGKRVGADFSLLVVGLGNDEMTPDALGPQTVRQMTVTRHRAGDGVRFLSEKPCEIAAFSPGVAGRTGLEAVELVRGAVAAVTPDLVVAVDALVARETGRLGSTVQLSDVGLAPGGGVGQARPALSADSLGAPVLALGVPTVVSTTALLRDAFARLSLDTETGEVADILQNGGGYLVAPREIDLLVPAAAALLAGALERAFSY